MDPKTDYSIWRFWLDAIQYLITVFVAAYVWLQSRDNIRKKDMDSVEGKLDGVVQERRAEREDDNRVISCIGNRVTKLENSTISTEDLRVVHDRNSKISDQVSNLSGKMDGIQNTVDMIQEFLLNNGSKR